MTEYVHNIQSQADGQRRVSFGQHWNEGITYKQKSSLARPKDSQTAGLVNRSILLINKRLQPLHFLLQTSTVREATARVSVEETPCHNEM